MSKARFPKELLSEIIEDNNQNWIDEYKGKSNCSKAYYLVLVNFFRYNRFSNLPFHEFDISSISDYIETMLNAEFSSDRIDFVLSVLNGFREFLIENHSDKFSREFLNDLVSYRVSRPEDRKNLPPEPLNLLQLNLLRDWLSVKNIKYQYIFEIFYQLGIQKQEIAVCQPKYADKERKHFKSGNKIIRYNDRISELLERIENENISKITYHMVSGYTDKMGEYLRSKGVYSKLKSFTYNDIIETHKRYFIKCPNCGSLKENTSENWVLVKNMFDNKMQLVCNVCKGDAAVD